MKYIRKLGLIVSAVVLSASAMAITADAQRIRVVRRPAIIHRHFFARDPFWHPRYWGDAYWFDPYYQAQRQKYYDQRSVKDAQKRLRKDRTKYNEDGYLSPKEQEKLAKDREKYQKAITRLRRDG